MKEDIRITKTKAKLKKALFELLKQETFEKINVSKICQSAMVNRVTFYTHYQDKYDLFQHCIEDIKYDIVKKLKENITENLNSLDAILKITQIITTNVIDLIFEYKEVIRQFGKQENSILTYIIDSSSKHFLTDLFKNIEPYVQFKYKKDYAISFIVGGTNKMIYDWIIKDKMKNITEFKNDLSLFLNDLLNSKILFKEKGL